MSLCCALFATGWEGESTCACAWPRAVAVPSAVIHTSLSLQSVHNSSPSCGSTRIRECGSPSQADALSSNPKGHPWPPPPLPPRKKRGHTAPPRRSERAHACTSHTLETASACAERPTIRSLRTWRLAARRSRSRTGHSPATRTAPPCSIGSGAPTRCQTCTAPGLPWHWLLVVYPYALVV